MSRVHPTAVIDKRAVLGEGVRVGPYCVIDGPVEVGANTELIAHATLMGNTRLGEGNRLFPGAVVGSEPQDLKYSGEETHLVIGDGNTFREHVTVHPGTAVGGGLTRIGNGNLFLVGSHVAHDCMIGSGVLLSNHVLLAGHVQVRDRAIMNGASACHHFTTIGRLAYVGGLTRITTDVFPFCVVEGHPARIRAANVIGMQRAGIDPADIELVKRAIHSIFISDRRTAAEAMAAFEEEHADHALVQELISAVRASEGGRQGRAAEAHRGGRAS